MIAVMSGVMLSNNISTDFDVIAAEVKNHHDCQVFFMLANHFQLRVIVMVSDGADLSMSQNMRHSRSVPKHM